MICTGTPARSWSENGAQARIGRVSANASACKTSPTALSTRKGWQQQGRLLRAYAASDTTSTETASCAGAIETLKEAASAFATGERLPGARDTFLALREVQRAKLNGDEWVPVIACGKYWRLVYTANAQAVAANNKNAEEGNGLYVPAVATNKLDLESATTGKMYTGASIPHVAAVQFAGEFEMANGITSFDMKDLSVKLGPFKLGPFSIPSQVKDGKGPFFKFFYADADIVCAIGRSGGIAMWTKASDASVAEKGLDTLATI